MQQYNDDRYAGKFQGEHNFDISKRSHENEEPVFDDIIESTEVKKEL